MKAYGGGELHLHSFLTLALDGVGGVLNALAALSLAKGPWHSLCSNLGGGQRAVWVTRSKEKSLAPARNQIMVPWLSSP